MHTSAIVRVVVGVSALVLTSLPSLAKPQFNPNSTCCGPVDVLMPAADGSDVYMKFPVLEREFTKLGEAQCCPPIDKPIDP